LALSLSLSRQVPQHCDRVIIEATAKTPRAAPWSSFGSRRVKRESVVNTVFIELADPKTQPVHVIPRKSDFRNIADWTSLSIARLKSPLIPELSLSLEGDFCMLFYLQTSRASFNHLDGVLAGRGSKVEEHPRENRLWLSIPRTKRHVSIDYE